MRWKRSQRTHRGISPRRGGVTPHAGSRRRDGVVFLALVVVLATRAPATTRLTDSPLLGQPAPPLAGTTIDGTDYDLVSERGRWVVLNFIATWCVPCRQEHPDLVRFQARHVQTRDATVVAVVYDDSVGAVRGFRAEEGGDWPMVLDPSGRVALEYGVRRIPESYLISPDGVVAAKITSRIRAEDLEELLAKAKRLPGGRAR